MAENVSWVGRSDGQNMLKDEEGAPHHALCAVRIAAVLEVCLGREVELVDVANTLKSFEMCAVVRPDPSMWRVVERM